MTVILDRFEGDSAVLLEGRQTKVVSQKALAQGIQEGDVVFLATDGIWKKSTEETEERKRSIAKKMDALWE